MTPVFELPAAAEGLAVALGAGLLVGLERERRKGQGDDRAAAGLRTFMVASLAGALAAAADMPGLVPVAVLAVAALAAMSYWKSRARDPGMTTEAALVVTCLIGALAVPQPMLAAAAATALAVLLAARARLHRFATRVLSAAELQDALWLAAIALIVLPVMPAGAVAALGGLNPRSLVGLVLLILLMQAAGHVALRVAGPRTGLAVSGFFGGFVSSTATIASMGTHARADAARQAACEAGALMSTAATWILALLMLSALAPPAALALLPGALAALLVAVGAGLFRARTGQAAPGEPAGRARLPAPGGRGGPLRLREAALIAAMLTGVTLGVGWMQQHYGGAGMLAAAALGAVADAHSSIAALGALHAAGRAGTPGVIDATLTALATNSLTRSVTAFVSGGARFGMVISATLAGSLLAALAVIVAMR